MPDPLDRIAAEAQAGNDTATVTMGSPPAPEAKGWRALFRPTPKTPEMFTDSMVAKTINWSLDRALKSETLAKEAMVGESTALCLDAMGATLPNGNLPIVYFGMSVGSFAFSLKGKRVAQSREPAPTP